LIKPENFGELEEVMKFAAIHGREDNSAVSVKQ
jgi:hypothetical protein